MSADKPRPVDPATPAALAVGRLLSPERLLARRSGDLMVLVDVESGKVFELNSTAARLWEHLREGMTAAQAVAELAREFGVGEEIVGADMAPFLSELRRYGLMVE